MDLTCAVVALLRVVVGAACPSFAVVASDVFDRGVANGVAWPTVFCGRKIVMPVTTGGLRGLICDGPRSRPLSPRLCGHSGLGINFQKSGCMGQRFVALSNARSRGLQYR